MENKTLLGPDVVKIEKLDERDYRRQFNAARELLYLAFPELKYK